MQRHADILGPSPYTGETGDVWSLNHPTTHDDWNPSQDIKFVYAMGQFHVSDKDDYDVLMRNAGAGPDYEGPMAIGTIHIDYGKAEFQVSTNLHAKGIERVLQLVCQKQGWQFGEVTDMAGQTLSDSKVSSIFFKEDRGMLKLAHSPQSLNQIDGAIHIEGKNAHIYPYRPPLLPALRDWANDSNMILLAGDNVIKTIEDLEEHNVYSPNWNDEEDHFLRKNPEDETSPEGPFECSNCHQSFPSMNSLILHRKNDEDPWDDVQTRPPVIEYNPTDGPDMDDVLPYKFRERPFYYGAQPLPAPVPFIYDIKNDQITVGMPGQTPDNMGAAPHFTPGQIIRGTFNPGGKLEIGSLSNVSVTIAHLLELWRYSQPQHTVRSVWIDVGNGQKPERVASNQESIWE